MGEGAYYLKYETDTTFTKITFTNAMNDRITGYDASYDPNGYLRQFAEDPSSYKKQHNLYAQVIENDINTRTFLTSKWTPSTSTTPDLTVDDEMGEGEDSNLAATQPKWGQEEALFALNGRFSIMGLNTNIGLANSLMRSLGTGVANSTTTQKLQASSVKETLVKPMYGEQSTSELTIGPLTESDLINLTFNGTTLVKRGENGTYSRNKEAFNNQIAIAPKVERMTITVDEEDATKFYVKYVSVGSNVAYECSEVMGLFGMNANPGAVASKLPGYSKIQYNGQQVTLISKDELTSFSDVGMKVEALSDKLLWNRSTGQRAFINTGV